MNEHQPTTSCIVHLAVSANFKGVTSNKLCSGLTGLCFESPNDTIHVTDSAEINGCGSLQTSSWFDSDVLRNRQLTIPPTVGNKCKKTDEQTDTVTLKLKQVKI